MQNYLRVHDFRDDFVDNADEGHGGASHVHDVLVERHHVLAGPRQTAALVQERMVKFITYKHQ